MNVDDAAYHVVHDVPGGAAALGARMGMSGALLGNKVNPNNERNVLTLGEAVKITGITGDLRILQAWAAAENCRLVPMDAEIDTAGASALVSTLLERNERDGRVSTVLREALTDGVISEREMREIEKACGDQQAVMLSLLRQVRGLQRVAP